MTATKRRRGAQPGNRNTAGKPKSPEHKAKIAAALRGNANAVKHKPAEQTSC